MGSASLLLAQQPPQPPIFRAGVGAVRIDVTVIGRDGLPVTDLTRDDFEVREDDVVQRIQVFEHRTLTGYPARDDESLAIRSADHARQEAGREEVRLLVLFLDDYHIRFGPLEDHQLRQRLVRFVTTEMRPLDLFAVMGPLTPISDLGLTRDRAALLRRINTLQGRLGGFVPPRSKVEEAHLSLGGANLARVRAQVSMSALESLAVHLGSLREGRKSVLFVSQGPAMHIGGYDMSDDLRDVIAAANRNNVTIHTLDPRELGQALMISEVNNALSIDTGGRRIGLTNDFSPALRGVMSDASDYYLLGYESPQVKPDGKFHDIDVRVRRKGIRVIARNGYWSPSPEEANTATAAAAAPPIPPEVSEALGALRDATRRVSVLDWIGVSPLDEGASRVSITFEPVTADPRLVPASVHVDVTLPGGATSTHAANPAADGIWQLEITSPPGRVTVRPAVKDGAGEVIDSWSRTAVVAAADSAASRIGTPIVLRARTVSQYRAIRAGDRVLPAAGRRFRRGDRVIVRLPLVAGDRPPVDVQLLSREGKPLRALPAIAHPGAADVELPLGNLAQAEYLVRFNVGAGDGATTTLVPFSLVP